METAPAYRYQIADPLEQEARHFASGVNHPGEVHGFFGSGRWVGITVGQARSGLFDALELYAGGGSCLFVDSGAFGEVDFIPHPVVNPARELDHAAWLERFVVWERCATAFRTRCFIVAPDRIGDQAHTIALLERYAANVAAVAALRAQIIVPVQKGSIPMGEFFRRQQAILNLRTAPIAGVPMKKDATSIAELAEFVDTLPINGSRIHLLGLGPASKGYDAVIRTIKTRRPDCSITSDSCTTARLVGRTNGPKSGPRILTITQDEGRALGLESSAAIKEYGLRVQGDAERDEDMDRRHAAGWFDVELFDTLEEAVAFHEASKAERRAGNALIAEVAAIVSKASKAVPA